MLICTFVSLLAIFANTIYAQTTPSKIRVATDFEILQHALWASPPGLPVEYWYNETTSPQDTYLGSVPGCPQSVDGVPWIYHGNPPKCFLAYRSGPCPPNSVLLLNLGNPFGFCGCECLAENKNLDKLLKSPERYLSCELPSPNGKLKPRLQIFDKRYSTCYVKGEQGSCTSGNIVSGYNNVSLICLSACDDQNDPRYAKNLCEHEIRQGDGALTEILPHDCPSGKMYSARLRSCVDQVTKSVG